MFWKKKTAATDITHPDSEDGRDAFRYHFKKAKAPALRFRDKDVTLVNLSAGGAAFKNQGFSVMDEDQVRFSLPFPDPGLKTDFEARFRILTIGEDNLCHGIFEQCTLEQHELLHRFILEMQKHDLAP